MAIETADKGRIGASGATDSCQIGQVSGGWACGGILELDECRVDLEGGRDMLRTLRAEIVAAEAANERQMGASVAADSGFGRVAAYLRA